MNPETRAYIERLLADQARQADAAGDLGFLGSVERLAGSPTGTGAGGSGARDTRAFWQNDDRGRTSGWTDPAAMAQALNEPGTVESLFDYAESWTYPLDGPSRALGAVVGGRNPLSAAPDQNAPYFSEALVEKGVPRWLATLAEFFAVPDPTGAKTIGDLIPALTLVAGLVPRRLVSTLGKLDPSGLNIQPYYHGTPYRHVGDFQPSPHGDLGPGLYFTEDPSYAGGWYTREQPFASEGPRVLGAEVAPNVFPGYIAGRVLNIDDLDPIPMNQARTTLAPIRDSDPVLYEHLMRKARRGELSEAELWREMYDIDMQILGHSPEWDPGFMGEPEWKSWVGRELLNEMGYAAAYSRRMGEGVVWDAKKYIAPWDVDAMLKAITDAGVLPPDELTDLSQEVSDWMAKWSAAQ
jgi:hypothetical protein